MHAHDTFVPLEFQRRRFAQIAVTDVPSHDVTLLIAVGRAFYWQHLIDTGAVKGGSEIAREEGLDHRTVNRHLKLTLLAPAMIDQWLQGMQPVPLTAHWCFRHEMPPVWDDQQQLICETFGDAS